MKPQTKARRAFWLRRFSSLASERGPLVSRKFYGKPLDAREKKLLRFIERQLDWYGIKLEEPANQHRLAQLRELRRMGRQIRAHLEKP